MNIYQMKMALISLERDHIENNLLTATIFFLVLYCMRCLLYSRQKNSKNEISGRILKTIPSAPAVPLLGSLPFLGGNARKVLTKWAKNYGSVFCMKLGRKNAIILNDYDAIHECFVKHGKHISGREQNPLVVKLWKGDGIIFLDHGEKWKSQSAFCYTAFRKILGKDNMYKVIGEEVDMLTKSMTMQLSNVRNNEDQDYLTGNYTRVEVGCDNISCTCNLQHEESEWVCFDHDLMMHQVGANITCRLLFGRIIDPDEKEFHAILRDTPIQARKSVAAFMATYLIPFLRNVPPIKGIIDEALNLRYATFKMIDHMIEEHFSTLYESENSDFIDLYADRLSNKTGKKDDPYFTDSQFKALIFDIFNAGAETTATTLMWTLLYLGKDTKLQAELRKEINDMCTADGRCVNSSDYASALPLTQAAIHEAIRIRPVTSLGIPHKTSVQCEVLGYRFPEQTVVMPNIWAVHHNENVFPNPEDFDPKRYLDDQGQFRPSNHVIGFSMGPRRCPGRKVAEITLLLSLVNIIKSFEFRLPQVYDPRLKANKSVEFDFTGIDGQILLPPKYWLQWRPL